MTFSELCKELEDAPQTQLPALLMKCVHECKKQRVFRDDDSLLKFISSQMIYFENKNRILE